jgi:hypothetical protein
MEYQPINHIDSANYWHHGTVQESTFVSSDHDNLIFEGIRVDSQMPHYMNSNYIGIGAVSPDGHTRVSRKAYGQLNNVMGDHNSPNPHDALSYQIKYRCWEHGCNGREFSSKSNLTRHQKEKSNAAAKSTCVLCGAIFTRNSARDTHLARQSCNRIRRYSNGRLRPSQLALLSNDKLVNRLSGEVCVDEVAFDDSTNCGGPHA